MSSVLNLKIYKIDNIEHYRKINMKFTWISTRPVDSFHTMIYLQSQGAESQSPREQREE